MTPPQPPQTPGGDDGDDGAAERRLARLRYDLHDGPQQDVYLLAQDLRLFRSQLRPILAGHPEERRVLGRLDDLDAQLAAVDAGLRRLSLSARSPFETPASMHDAVTRLTGEFTQHTGIAPRTTIAGTFHHLSESQRLAVLALVRESLSNVRRHSGAAAVAISLTTDGDRVTIRIEDDGAGFDPAATIAAAADAGRLGLVGMRERTRMLGGRTEIDSRPGGPTIVTATLPRWPAPEPGPAAPEPGAGPATA